MSDLTDLLKREHKIILRRLARLERALAEHADEPLRKELALLTGELAPHRRKEEEFLFPELDRRYGSSCAPVHCMLDEHGEEKRHLDALTSALESGDRDAIVRGGQALLDHVRNHIWKEDHILFPMAEKSLEGAARDRVLAGFREIGACRGDPDAGRD